MVPAPKSLNTRRRRPVDIFRLLLLFWEGGVWVSLSRGTANRQRTDAESQADADAIPLRPLVHFPGLYNNGGARNIADTTLLKLAESARLSEQTGLVDRLLNGDISVSAVAKAVRVDVRGLNGVPRTPSRLLVRSSTMQRRVRSTGGRSPCRAGWQLCTVKSGRSSFAASANCAHHSGP